MEKLNIVFFGTPEFAVPSLETLISRGENLAAVVTQPDKPAGRGKKPAASAVRQIARCHHLPVLQPERVREDGFAGEIKKINPDICIVAAFGQIFPKNLLEIPRFGFINVHASLLPRYRGASPINYALINGDDHTGITIMQVDEGLDTGDIILQQSTAIRPEDDAQTLGVRMAQLGAATLATALDLKHRQGWHPVPQDDALATYAPQLRKEDGCIPWQDTGRNIVNRIRGMTPWPGCFTYLDGKRIKIHKAAFTADTAGTSTPGDILYVSNRGIVTAAGEGSVVITELQSEGKKRMTAEAFIRGYRFEKSARFSSGLPNP